MELYSDDDYHNLVQIAPGVSVEDDVLGIVDWIRSYDENLDVLYLDPSFPGIEPGDPPYVIIELGKDGKIHVVMKCWTLDERVKERIYAADNQKFNVLLTLDEHNAAVKADQDRRFQEVREQAVDLATHMFKNPKTSYTFENTQGELITVEDDKGVVKRQ